MVCFICSGNLFTVALNSLIARWTFLAAFPAPNGSYPWTTAGEKMIRIAATNGKIPPAVDNFVVLTFIDTRFFIILLSPAPIATNYRAVCVIYFGPECFRLTRQANRGHFSMQKHNYMVSRIACRFALYSAGVM